ncbi:hypothetical protein [Rubellimicrobium roseum]|uniref:VPLPA-CTERM sorting domain-containing protein n=1 Tax=Rubellimicrobium roseum TaxID=687525 RepID=A0A5C4NBZ8_9RHOB|nr:hypothetical protein [Rubellimicrobium roseum]TNC71405.1 hypothetical protein FHG71_11665 [Rubellimicrobium roseum]
MAETNVERLGSDTTIAFGTGPVRDFACFEGNDTNSIGAGFVLFGQTGWLLADKSDDAVSGDGKLRFEMLPRGGRTSGTFSIANPLGLPEVAVTLKAGAGFAAALLDGLQADGRSFSWTLRRDLSHASIYYRPQAQVPLPPVPLPAGGVLLLSGLVGILALRFARSAPLFQVRESERATDGPPVACP